ncbi:MAG: hypothetical protein ACE5PT_02070 [Gemmatimonadales bacterium]
MNENLKAKLLRKIDGLSDQAGRQLLDYVEFLESKHNRSRRSASPFEKVAENIEGLGSGKLADAAAKGTADVVDAVGRVMAGLAAATKAAADEIQGVAKRAAEQAEETGEAEEAEVRESEQQEGPEESVGSGGEADRPA